MKKNYFAPKSETLSAILKDMCQATGDPGTTGTVSGSIGGGGSMSLPEGAPRRL